MAGANVAMGRHDMSAEPLRGLHILVVDDDATVRGIISAIIAHGGALVTEASSAEAAWLSVARIMPEVIVCALHLGEARDAYGLLHRIRTMSTPRRRDIPIIAIARGPDLTPMDEVLEAGFAGYVKTPLDPRQLCELIADVADVHPRDDGRAD
jgi:CheY-like chemotaxis protein